MDIAFCINRLGLTGLGVTITSLIRNCSNTKHLTIWFLCAGLANKEKVQIIRLLRKEQFLGVYKFVDFDPSKMFKSFASLHGNWTTYGRLLLSDHIPAGKVLYLDCDLLIGLDVLEIENFDCQDKILGAVGGGKFKYTLGRKFYIDRLGVSPDIEYFNAGVLVLNLTKWRSQHIKDQCLNLASQFSLELPSHDQSILNLICRGSFAKLPVTFNCEWCADQPKPKISEKMILHFVGSPKPWDPFGSLIHNGYKDWFKYSDKEWIDNFSGLTLSTLSRTWKIRRSYVRCIRNKMIH